MASSIPTSVCSFVTYAYIFNFNQSSMHTGLLKAKKQYQILVSSWFSKAASRDMYPFFLKFHSFPNLCLLSVNLQENTFTVMLSTQNRVIWPLVVIKFRIWRTSSQLCVTNRLRLYDL